MRVPRNPRKLSQSGYPPIPPVSPSNRCFGPSYNHNPLLNPQLPLPSQSNGFITSTPILSCNDSAFVCDSGIFTPKLKPIVDDYSEPEADTALKSSVYENSANPLATFNKTLFKQYLSENVIPTSGCTFEDFRRTGSPRNMGYLPKEDLFSIGSTSGYKRRRSASASASVAPHSPNYNTQMNSPIPAPLSPCMLPPSPLSTCVLPQSPAPASPCMLPPESPAPVVQNVPAPMISDSELENLIDQICESNVSSVVEQDSNDTIPYGHSPASESFLNMSKEDADSTADTIDYATISQPGISIPSPAPSTPLNPARMSKSNSFDSINPDLGCITPILQYMQDDPSKFANDSLLLGLNDFNPSDIDLSSGSINTSRQNSGRNVDLSDISQIKLDTNSDTKSGIEAVERILKKLASSKAKVPIETGSVHSSDIEDLIKESDDEDSIILTVTKVSELQSPKHDQKLILSSLTVKEDPDLDGADAMNDEIDQTIMDLAVDNENTLNFDIDKEDETEPVSDDVALMENETEPVMEDVLSDKQDGRGPVSEDVALDNHDVTEPVADDVALDVENETEPARKDVSSAGGREPVIEDAAFDKHDETEPVAEDIALDKQDEVEPIREDVTFKYSGNYFSERDDDKMKCEAIFNLPINEKTSEEDIERNNAGVADGSIIGPFTEKRLDSSFLPERKLYDGLAWENIARDDMDAESASTWTRLDSDTDSSPRHNSLSSNSPHVSITSNSPHMSCTAYSPHYGMRSPRSLCNTTVPSPGGPNDCIRQPADFIVPSPVECNENNRQVPASGHNDALLSDGNNNSNDSKPEDGIEQMITARRETVRARIRKRRSTSTHFDEPLCKNPRSAEPKVVLKRLKINVLESGCIKLTDFYKKTQSKIQVINVGEKITYEKESALDHNEVKKADPPELRPEVMESSDSVSTQELDKVDVPAKKMIDAITDIPEKGPSTAAVELETKVPGNGPLETPNDSENKAQSCTCAEQGFFGNLNCLYRIRSPGFSRFYLIKRETSFYIILEELKSKNVFKDDISKLVAQAGDTKTIKFTPSEISALKSVNLISKTKDFVPIGIRVQDINEFTKDYELRLNLLEPFSTLVDASDLELECQFVQSVKLRTESKSQCEYCLKEQWKAVESAYFTQTVRGRVYIYKPVFDKRKLKAPAQNLTVNSTAESTAAVQIEGNKEQSVVSDNASSPRKKGRPRKKIRCLSISVKKPSTQDKMNKVSHSISVKETLNRDQIKKVNRPIRSSRTLDITGIGFNSSRLQAKYEKNLSKTDEVSFTDIQDKKMNAPLTVRSDEKVDKCSDNTLESSDSRSDSFVQDQVEVILKKRLGTQEGRLRLPDGRFVPRNMRHGILKKQKSNKKAVKNSSSGKPGSITSNIPNGHVSKLAPIKRKSLENVDSMLERDIKKRLSDESMYQIHSLNMSKSSMRANDNDPSFGIVEVINSKETSDLIAANYGVKRLNINITRINDNKKVKCEITSSKTSNRTLNNEEIENNVREVLDRVIDNVLLISENKKHCEKSGSGKNIVESNVKCNKTTGKCSGSGTVMEYNSRNDKLPRRKSVSTKNNNETPRTKSGSDKNVESNAKSTEKSCSDKNLDVNVDIDASDGMTIVSHVKNNIRSCRKNSGSAKNDKSPRRNSDSNDTNDESPSKTSGSGKNVNKNPNLGSSKSIDSDVTNDELPGKNSRSDRNMESTSKDSSSGKIVESVSRNQKSLWKNSSSGKNTGYNATNGESPGKKSSSSQNIETNFSNEESSQKNSSCDRNVVSNVSNDKSPRKNPRSDKNATNQELPLKVQSSDKNMEYNVMNQESLGEISSSSKNLESKSFRVESPRKGSKSVKNNVKNDKSLRRNSSPGRNMKSNVRNDQSSRKSTISVKNLESTNMESNVSNVESPPKGSSSVKNNESNVTNDRPSRRNSSSGRNMESNVNKDKSPRKNNSSSQVNSSSGRNMNSNVKSDKSPRRNSSPGRTSESNVKTDKSPRKITSSAKNLESTNMESNVSDVESPRKGSSSVKNNESNVTNDRSLRRNSSSGRNMECNVKNDKSPRRTSSPARNMESNGNNDKSPRRTSSPARNMESNVMNDKSPRKNTSSIKNFESTNMESNVESPLKDSNFVKNIESNVSNVESPLKASSSLKNIESNVKNDKSSRRNASSGRNVECNVKNDKSPQNSMESNVKNHKSTPKSSESGKNSSSITNMESNVESPRKDSSSVKNIESNVKNYKSCRRNSSPGLCMESNVKNDILPNVKNRRNSCSVTNMELSVKIDKSFRKNPSSDENLTSTITNLESLPKNSDSSKNMESNDTTEESPQKPSSCGKNMDSNSGDSTYCDINMSQSEVPVSSRTSCDQFSSNLDKIFESVVDGTSDMPSHVSSTDISPVESAPGKLDSTCNNVTSKCGNISVSNNPLINRNEEHEIPESTFDLPGIKSETTGSERKDSISEPKPDIVEVDYSTFLSEIGESKDNPKIPKTPRNKFKTVLKSPHDDTIGITPKNDQSNNSMEDEIISLCNGVMTHTQCSNNTRGKQRMPSIIEIHRPNKKLKCPIHGDYVTFLENLSRPRSSGTSNKCQGRSKSQSPASLDCCVRVIDIRKQLKRLNLNVR